MQERTHGKRLKKDKKSEDEKYKMNLRDEGNVYLCFVPRIDQLKDKTDNDRARKIKLEKAMHGIAAEIKREIYAKAK